MCLVFPKPQVKILYDISVVGLMDMSYKSEPCLADTTLPMRHHRTSPALMFMTDATVSFELVCIHLQFLSDGKYNNKNNNYSFNERKYATIKRTVQYVAIAEEIIRNGIK